MERITRAESVEIDEILRLIIKDEFPLGVQLVYGRPASLLYRERLSFFGIATSLIIHLTKVTHQDLKTAAKSVNYWTGVTTLMPLLGGFLVDAYLGRFSIILPSSTVYFLVDQGMLLLTMSRVVRSLKPCESDLCDKRRNVHEPIFFLAIYLISVGTGGHKPSLESFGADQFDDENHYTIWTTGNERGISILQRIGVGMIFSVSIMIVAALIERKRLNLVHKNPLEGPYPRSSRWICLSGIARIRLRPRKDLNSSRLDYFYWLLAIMTAVNLCVNVIVARNYSYKNVHCKAAMSVADCDDRDNHEAMA
ncbi:hypothetical protein MTR67_045627 [Solanum verrucosum]|uniref:Uncharacterized protein n=1 Tax=Solanum verrucosum TaxID=315347 RepID=A0AAF0UTP3_SOLVR|nr:hypothetical protein MTR67_045627 [Solanum verrucosum]